MSRKRERGQSLSPFYRFRSSSELPKLLVDYVVVAPTPLGRNRVGDPNVKRRLAMYVGGSFLVVILLLVLLVMLL